MAATRLLQYGLPGAGGLGLLRNVFLVFRGQDGKIDHTIPVAVMQFTDTQVSIPHQALPANTIWHYVRRKVDDCGLQSPDSLISIVIIDSNGDALAAAPNAPTDLTAEVLAGGKIKLRWRYSTANQAAVPDGFNIYEDSGSGFNFATPTATVSAPAGLSRSAAAQPTPWISGALTHGQLYKYVVRAYKTAGGESQNTNYTAITADAVGPSAIKNLRAKWELI